MTQKLSPAQRIAMRNAAQRPQLPARPAATISPGKPAPPAPARIGSTVRPDTDIERVYASWQADPDPAHEAEHMRRFARAAIVAGWRYTADDGTTDLGAVGWCQWAGLPVSTIHELPITPLATNTPAVSATPAAGRAPSAASVGSADSGYWQFVVSGEAEALAFAAEAA